MDYSKYSQLLVEVDDRIATVTMNRPDKLNVANAALHTELSTIFVDLQRDRNVDVVVVTGAGRAFSAGGDIDWMQDAIDDLESFDQTRDEAKRIIFSLLDLEKPIIAKVNGHAVGLGATLALFCDVIFASEKARIGDPHVSVGFVAGDGGAIIWPQLIGYARAKEYLFTGDLIGAQQAADIGLINYAVPSESLDQRVAEFAGRLRNGATKAIRFTKIATNIALKQAVYAAMDTSIAYETITNASADHAEAVAAFREKRTPKFQGR